MIFLKGSFDLISIFWSLLCGKFAVSLETKISHKRLFFAPGGSRGARTPDLLGVNEAL